jgi:thiol-disulfide isomerase/thioredoxin
MRSTLPIVCTLIAALAIGAVAADPSPLLSRSTGTISASAVPEFTHRSKDDWLNSPPLSLRALKGKVVLVEFWAFDCVNCLRTVAWLHSVQEKYATQNFTIVSVHTPELAQERSTDNVIKAIAQQHITYPVMLDGDYSYWNALNNQYWPALYLIDMNGQVVARAIGEMHVGESSALKFEKKIDDALAHTR